MLNLPQNPKWDIARVSHSTLVNADCFDVFPFIEDKSIDAIICDLPYGATQNKWDSILPLNELWKEYKRILKDGGCIVLFGNQPFTSDLIYSNRDWFKYEIIWDKGRASGHLNAKIMPLRKHDNILIFAKKKTTYNPQFTNGDAYTRTSKSETCRGNYGKHEDSTIVNDGYRYPTTIFYEPIGRQQNKTHPTEKPIGLLEMLVKTYTNEGDTVLDNTMGSGTTNLACLKLNRKSIGIEKEKQYYDVAVRRLSSYCG
jgi:site-specific DNA-methyltransferase (adenine-specific)